ncbi:MAG: hypothetical protein H5T86_06820 [Armatimonadetes bacterium]|nr:hypothetical protein [Armatimonadota bacterium]
MSDKKLEQAIAEARAKLEGVIQRVCGACERSCCHQGTMMGSQDLRRLIRGLQIEPALAARLREGLRERAAEVWADVEVAQRVLELMRSAALGSSQDLAAAEEALERLRDLAELMSSDFPLDYEHLARLLFHTALRHNVIRAFRVLPGGEAALTRFAGQGSSFRYRGRRMAPPRCIFHSLALGCLAGRWKPAKCANFFCPADPGVLDALRAEMDFDAFVLANMELVGLSRLKEILASMIELGPDYWEPVVVLGMSGPQAAELAEAVRCAGLAARVEEHSGPAPTAGDIELWGENVGLGEAVLHLVTSLSPRDLYDVAIGFERLRINEMNRLVVLGAHKLEWPSPAPHALWSDRMMAQPVGYLEVYFLASDAS